MKSLRTIDAKTNRLLGLTLAMARELSRQRAELESTIRCMTRILALAEQQTKLITTLTDRVVTLEGALADQGEGWKLGAEPDPEE